MSTTVSPVLLEHHWKGDGTNFWRIQIIHNRKKKYIKTNVCVTKGDLNRAGKIKDLAIQDQIDKLLSKIRKAIANIDMFDLEKMSIEQVVAKVVEAMKGEEKFSLDFVEYGYRVAERKSPGNAKAYYIALNALVRFFNGRHPDISEITVRNLRAFEEYIKEENVVKVNWRTGESKQVEGKKKGGRAASLYLASIRHIYKCARIEFNDPDLGKFLLPVDPFEYYSLPKIPATKHRAVPVEVIQRMIDTRKDYAGRQRMAVDAFLISFGLCGINPADMFRCDKPKKGVLHYFRQKTEKRRDDRAEMWVKIHPCIQKIMKDYEDADRCFDYYKRYANKDVFITALNQGLTLWQEKEKMGVERFTFTAARHSWATIGSGKLCDIKESVITVGMCHVDEDRKTDNIYIKFDWEELWDAQKKILDVFKWE